MNKITTLLLDFGNVLVHLHSVEELRAMLENLGQPVSGKIGEMLLDPGHSEIFWKVMRGETTETQLWELLAREWNIPFETARDLMQSISAPDRPNLPLIQYIKSLKGRYRIGVLSNAGNETLERLLQVYPYDEFVDVFVISADVRLAKPDPEIYQVALRKLGARAEECLFVDDLEENIAAAQKLGIRGILHRNNAETIARLKVMLKEE